MNRIEIINLGKNEGRILFDLTIDDKFELVGSLEEVLDRLKEKIK